MAAREKTEKAFASCSPVVTVTGVDLAKSSHCKYLLISPCRDEAKYMQETLDSVISQSIQPAKWVIVDDVSTDNTPQILASTKRSMTGSKSSLEAMRTIGGRFGRHRCVLCGI